MRLGQGVLDNEHTRAIFINVVSICVLIGISVFMLVVIARFPAPSRLHVGRDVGIDFFPRIITYALMALTGVLALNTVFMYVKYARLQQGRQTEEEAEAAAAGASTDPPQVVRLRSVRYIAGFIVLSVVYAWWGLNAFGFIAATIVFIFLLAWLVFEGRKIPVIALFSVLLTLFLYYVFRVLLRVPLP